MPQVRPTYLFGYVGLTCSMQDLFFFFLSFFLSVFKLQHVGSLVRACKLFLGI